MSFQEITEQSEKQDINKNSDASDCILVDSSSKAKSLSYITYSLIIIELILGLIYVIFSKGSINGLFITICYAQMLVLFLMFDASLPNNILGYLFEISGVLLHLSFIPKVLLEISYPNCNQAVRKLDLCLITNLMGFESRSSINTLVLHFLFFCCLIIFQSVVFILLHRARKQQTGVSICLLIMN